MKIGLVIYGSLDAMSGGYLYDRKLAAHLQSHGDTVEIISLPWRNYLAHLTDNLHFRLPDDLDILIEDELNHPSLLIANRQPRAFPIISLVHNLRSSERRPAWQNSIYRYIEKHYLRSVNGFIFNSPITRESVLSLVDKDKPYVIAPPGGDRLGSLETEAISARAVESGPLRLVFLANVTPLKGLHVVLNALQQLPPTNYQLNVIGSIDVDPKYAADMEKLVGSLGLSACVHFCGILNGEALIDELRKAQVMVIPSYYEGFGIAVLEGMAFGLPAIGTTAGAIPQLVTDGKNGYLIEPGNDETLANRLATLASDRQLLLRLSFNARQRFQFQPTWEQSMQTVREFLLRTIKNYSNSSN